MTNPKLLSLALVAALSLHAENLTVLFGSHSTGPGEGFSIAHFDTKTGVLTKPQLMLEAAAPAYFVIAPNRRFLYTCNSPGFLSAYAVDPATAKLTFLNQKPSGGGDPSYISLDKTSKYVFVANYQGGNMGAWAILPDGSLGERTAFIQDTGSSVHPVRQTKAYAHSILVDPTNHYVLAADLGLDKVFVYKFDVKTGALNPHVPHFATVTPGSGPRHITFHPNGHWAYVITEMGSTINLFNWDATRGALTHVQTISALPADFHGVSTSAEVRVHPNGKFLYASNRGRDSIGVFSIDPATGRLAPLQDVPSGGHVPRNFDFDPSGNWLLVSNQESNNAMVFRINTETGLLTPTGSPVEVHHPFSPRFLSNSVTDR